jgi:hypothetical protein
MLHLYAFEYVWILMWYMQFCQSYDFDFKENWVVKIGQFKQIFSTTWYHLFLTLLNIIIRCTATGHVTFLHYCLCSFCWGLFSLKLKINVGTPWVWGMWSLHWVAWVLSWRVDSGSDFKFSEVLPVRVLDLLGVGQRGFRGGPLSGDENPD